ncbi:hypothetical protein GCM10017778_15300 [Streptomyces vinaceus]|nr:hypothetical protein GCM10017778_15300 [Streptomyces vinaceus]
MVDLGELAAGFERDASGQIVGGELVTDSEHVLSLREGKVVPFGAFPEGLDVSHMLAQAALIAEIANGGRADQASLSMPSYGQEATQGDRFGGSFQQDSVSETPARDPGLV